MITEDTGRPLPQVRSRCPKQMVYGPCGGVRVDGRCEMADHTCVFVDLTDAVPAERVPGAPHVAIPRVLTDLSTPPADAATLRATARVLAPSCDAVLLGDHQDRADFPPSLLARLVAEAGATPWVTMACRDRNRVVLESELHGLAHDGVATLLAVTGDGRAFDVRADVSQVFDLDSTRLTALAAATGVPVAVTEAPTAPPVELRPARLVQKERAGAGVAVLNHVASGAEVERFVRAARARGLSIPVIASVPVYTDERSAAVLDALPGLSLDRATVSRVLGAADPVAAGIESAVAEAAELLRIEGVVGVNLSGMVSARGVAEAAAIQVEIGHRVRAGAGVGR